MPKSQWCRAAEGSYSAVTRLHFVLYQGSSGSPGGRAYEHALLSDGFAATQTEDERHLVTTLANLER